jgi:hypothetical protein
MKPSNAQIARQRSYDAQIKALHDEYVAPVIAAAQRAFGSSDGEKVLQALERAFTDKMVVKDGNGKVDADAVLINVGAARVINYLRALAESKGQER